jgi:hypothetical protein
MWDEGKWFGMASWSLAVLEICKLHLTLAILFVGGNTM